ncbi:chorismate mutase [Porphyrobacter sp. GA68]|uniref:chorismate mutase n=1 Tax=Porphyrobacter sp. GA68 TaxID=2883480 RepID=UPI001D192EEE|nr:chorismate mutase [Porphyrobacter sp. GA68]
MPSNAAPAMAALRAQIDRLDTELLLLMEQRLALSRSIAAAKRKEPVAPMLRPDREEQVVARLAAQATRMPEESIVAIWRELMSLNLQAQRRTELVIHAPQHFGGIAGRASARFGVSAPVVHVDTVSQALAKARRFHAIAVIELSQHDDWWRVLAHDAQLRIIDDLRAPGGRGSALAIAAVEDSHLPRTRRCEVIEEGELVARLCRGETICPIAVAGNLRLCIAENLSWSKQAAA